MATDNSYKGVKCKICGETLRTPQGLSGHIRFRHGGKEGKKDLFSIPEIMAMGLTWQKKNKKLGFSEVYLNEVQFLIARWAWVQDVCRSLKIPLTKQDFKAYLLSGLASLMAQEAKETANSFVVHAPVKFK